MTLQVMKKELKKIKRKILDIEKELILEDVNRKVSSNQKKKSKEFLKEWTELSKEVSSKWDGIPLTEELKYQRENN
jgi:hypothetical protein